MRRPARSTAATDERFMARALDLARRGLGRTSPNPAVGALVVREGTVVGSGFHRRAGGPHAEIYAIRRAGGAARGATLYVTLEPCCHHGRTGPCIDAVLTSGIARVVVGAIDPNRAVHGAGVRRLREAGLEVDVGVLGEECRRLNEDFEKLVTTGLPFVVLKLASTLDGRIAVRGGDSRWVTGPAARRRVHEMRNRFDAVIVGSETVLRDDPQLTCRIAGGRDPVRVVLDGRLRVPETARVYSTRGAHVRVYTLHDRSRKAARLASRGITVLRGGGDRPGSLSAVLRDLAGHGLKSVLVEGGGTVAARALRERLVDRLVVFVAAKILGAEGRPMVGDLGIRRMSEAVTVGDVRLERVGDDWMVDGRPAWPRAVGFRKSA